MIAHIKTSVLLLTIALFITVISPPALAGSKEKHAHHSKSPEANKIVWDDEKLSLHISFEDRKVIESYLVNSHRKKCPPGLAKKRNGCLPPGQAKKYAIGKKLPEGIFYESLPLDLLEILRPAPKGYKYISVDKDVLLMSEATKKVVDAVTLLSAVGR